ncbi:protein phosphatase [Lithospermum erythrorhizon]|uniref:Serine/threonine protein phosphatase 2A regulatory subunit n=1 Tax=Lithospermum erythrorhizon TaxID=34254 RepID=A0AAV3RMQ9_LITER
MLKQILAKFPRKSSKTSPVDSVENNSCNNDANLGNGVPLTNSCTVLSTRLNVVKRMSSAIFPASVTSGAMPVEPQVPFKDVANSEKQNLLVSKLNLCCLVYDFRDSSRNSSDKELKHQMLLELNDFVASGSAKFSETAIAAICKMCAENIFREFPPKHNYRTTRSETEEDDEPLLDPAWWHLQLVYELFIQLLGQGSFDVKMAKQYIDQRFILQLLDLFDSEDPRERDCLKSILHRIYGKFMVHRPFIRQAVSNILYRFAFETDSHNGIAELLEVFGSVISGFALPLKEEHKLFLSKALIPLHKPKSLGVYHQQLAYCIVQFVEKEQKLVSVVIKGLLKYWPVTNSKKELIFISEMEELLEMINMADFEKIAVPLFRRIGGCLNSSHFQVAERAHFLWNNDHIVNLIMHSRHLIMPIIFSALEKNNKNHWNKAVLNLTQNVRKVFSEMDEELALACQCRLGEENSKLDFIAERRKLTWEHLETSASFQIAPSSTVVTVEPATSILAL